MKNNLRTHMFNASYIAIALYGVRKILHKINPITFDSAVAYIDSLTKKPGQGIYLVHEDGTAYLIAYEPKNASQRVGLNIRGAIAETMGHIRGARWRRVVSETDLDRFNIKKSNTVTTPVFLTGLIPPESADRIPGLALSLKKLYGDK